MYLNKQKKPNGDVYLSIREKYHIPKVGSREKTIETLGYLSKLKETIDDPIAYYTQYAKELTEKSKAKKSRTITIDATEEMAIDEDDFKNVGYGILKEIAPSYPVFLSVRLLISALSTVIFRLLLTLLPQADISCFSMQNGMLLSSSSTNPMIFFMLLLTCVTFCASFVTYLRR